MAVRIETDNYIIRDVQFSDYEYFARWEVDPDMTKYFALDKDRTYEDVVTEGFAFKEDKSVIDLTITEKSTGNPLGRIIISRIEPHYKSLDITKIYIGGDRRGQGIGREVLIGLMKYLFEELDMQRVTLDYFTGNVKAANLYRRLGFVDEGVARNACSKDGIYYDLNLMSILRDEYFAIYG
ncbi:MAG: GNAT family N-acetyltransferase [Clostridiales bacterium]|nr:GNAT family N-acetyltransferase [Clostridiales bacterium]